MSTPRWKQPDTARKADRWELYEYSVQSVDHEISFVDRAYRKIRGGPASRLREDFCATAQSACEWVRRRPSNTAVALDIDPAALELGRRRHVARLPEGARARIELLRCDVLTPTRRAWGADIVLAMNFSYWVFTTRPRMVAYFRKVRATLAPEGLFFLDHFGGWAATREQRERTRYHKFTYVWDQHRFNPITNEMTCYIHFEFRDGSRLERAFEYRWRVWSLPEVREMLHEAGFTRTTVFWEGTSKDGSGNGVFRPSADHPEACESFVTYIVAEP
jgi:hypothetical protein